MTFQQKEDILKVMDQKEHWICGKLVDPKMAEQKPPLPQGSTPPTTVSASANEESHNITDKGWFLRPIKNTIEF